MCIKYAKPTDLLIFCDTGREHPLTYKFLDDFEKYEGFKIVRIGNKNAFSEMLQKRNYNEIPNIAKRSCTRELKIIPARRYLRKLGLMRYNNFIGFRSDEISRVNKFKKKYQQVSDCFPLAFDGTTKEVVNEFWSNKNYNLQIPDILGNCTLCFMKGKNQIIRILMSFPELATPWIEDEKKASESYGHTYINGITISQMLHIAQNNLFKDFPLDELTPSYNCSCGV
jgi:hypothetical protein